MSLHPKKAPTLADLGGAIDRPDVTPRPAPRPTVRWLGFTLTKNFIRCPVTKECLIAPDPRYNADGSVK